jgi:hypothetical protein
MANAGELQNRSNFPGAIPKSLEADFLALEFVGL